MTHAHTWMRAAFVAVAIDDEGRACIDIPESACEEEAGNFFTHVGALTLSKVADGLIDPKLVLSWLFASLGVPAALTGLLVPIREAGALLPQLFTAEALRRLPQRKWAWTIGAAVQGGSALAIAASALLLDGVVAGVAILAALACLAIARSVCSVCYKDVLGKTIDKSRRGTATGLAGSIAAVVVLAYAATLSLGLVDRMHLFMAGLLVAGGAWLLGGVLFTRLTEEPGATEGGKSAFRAAMENLSYLKTQPQLRRFILARGLLTATALSPPFMVAAAAQQSRSGAAYEALGFLIMASSGAGLVSSFVWGRLSDKSSRKVLIRAGLVSAAALGVTAALALAGGLAQPFVLPGLLFVLMIAYQGVRLGRSTHLVDMANETNRAAFTALSNTIIGTLLLLGGAFSLLAGIAGTGVVLAVMAVMCAASVPVSAGLAEVQSEGRAG